jgi:hypothetical protein
MESKALELRLTIHENQALGFRHRIQGMEIEQHKNEAFSLGKGFICYFIGLDLCFLHLQSNGFLLQATF